MKISRRRRLIKLAHIAAYAFAALFLIEASIATVVRIVGSGATRQGAGDVVDGALTSCAIFLILGHELWHLKR